MKTICLILVLFTLNTIYASEYISSVINGEKTENVTANGEDSIQYSDEFSSLNVFVDKLKQNPDNLLEILKNEHQVDTEDFVSLLDSNKGILERTIKTIKTINNKFYFLSGVSKITNTINKKESIHYTFSITEEGFNALNQNEDDDMHKLSKDQMEITIQFKINESNSNSKWLKNKLYKFIGLFNSTIHYPYNFFD